MAASLQPCQTFYFPDRNENYSIELALRQILLIEELSDMVFLLSSGEKIKAHKVVLSMFSHLCLKWFKESPKENTFSCKFETVYYC